MRANKVFRQISGSESLHHDQRSANYTQYQLNVSKTSDHKARNSDPVIAVYNDNQVRSHIDQSPRHTNHVHVVEVKLYISSNNG